MKIVHNRRLSRDLVAVERFGKDRGGLRPENMVTPSTPPYGRIDRALKNGTSIEADIEPLRTEQFRWLS
jgi:hypothetical protein